MSETEMKYKDICERNIVSEELLLSRRNLKSVIEDELFDVDFEFSNSVCKNQSQRISLKAAKDLVFSRAEETNSANSQMKILCEAAKILRICTLSAKKWLFEGSVATDSQESNVLAELKFFFKWCTAGISQFSTSTNTANVQYVNNRASSLSQVLMYECLTNRQASSRYSSSIQHINCFPFQVGIGLTVRSHTRSKFLAQLLHSLGCSIDYSRVLCLETAIANSVLHQVELNDGQYILPQLV